MQLGLPLEPRSPDPTSLAPTPHALIPTPHALSPLIPHLVFVRHSRARRYLIRVEDDGCVRVTVPRLYEHLNPMSYAKALQSEADLADSLRKRGYAVYGGH